MKKALGIALVVLGTLVGVPSVIACFTIILLPVGLPFTLVGAGLVILGLHLLGRNVDVVTDKLRHRVRP